jgi:hypothetical protein
MRTLFYLRPEDHDLRCASAPTLEATFRFSNLSMQIVRDCHSGPPDSAIAGIVFGADPNRVLTPVRVIVPASGAKQNCE